MARPLTEWEAFVLTIKKFDISVKDHAIKADVHSNTITNYMNGKGLRKDTFDRLVNAFEGEAKSYYQELVYPFRLIA